MGLLDDMANQLTAEIIEILKDECIFAPEENEDYPADTQAKSRIDIASRRAINSAFHAGKNSK